MVSHEPSDTTAHADGLVCRSAVQLTRARRMAGVAGKDLAPAVDRLLSVVRLELDTNPESVPTTIRSAAVQLAAHLLQRYRSPFRATASTATSRSSTRPAGPPEPGEGRLSRSPPRVAPSPGTRSGG